MEKIKVKITSDGKAKEINQEQDMSYLTDKLSIPSRKALDKHRKWEQAELKLRTFEIEGNYLPRYEKYNDGFFSFYTHKVVMIDSIYTAEIIDTNKLIVRIL